MMGAQFGNTKIGAMQYGGVTIGEAMIDGVIVYRSALPVVTITGTSGNTSRDQFRQACIDHGTTYQTVEVLPFLLDTSQATNMVSMFQGCSSLTTVPDIDTSQVTAMSNMFNGCTSLTTVPDIWPVSATNMDGVFRDCASLVTAPQIDMRNAQRAVSLFNGCSSLTYVPDLITGSLDWANAMFFNCSALTDGNVRLIGKKSDVNVYNMISGSGLTREPWFDTDGNPI